MRCCHIERKDLDIAKVKFHIMQSSAKHMFISCICLADDCMT